MDETTVELLSRYLDADLGEDELEHVGALLASHPEAREELEAMRKLKTAVGSLATADQPPIELESLVEPLRRSIPAPAGVRPVYRWLGIAACLVIGVTVVLQVRRDNPAPRLPSAAAPHVRPAPTPTGAIFQLQPLPDSSAGGDSELTGAAERFLATPLPEPRIEAPPAFEAVGPLPQEAWEAREKETARIAGLAQESSIGGARPLGDQAGIQGAREQTEGAGASGQTKSRAMRSFGDAKGAASPARKVRRAEVAEAVKPRRTLPLSANLELLAQPELPRFSISLTRGVPPGLYSLSVEVSAEVIASCRVLEPDRSDEAVADVCGAILDAALDGAGDGRYSARLRVW